MQIVVDIPEENCLMMRMADQFTINKYDMGSYAIYCILNGTPLPKGHGRLIDWDSDETYRALRPYISGSDIWATEI